MCCGCDSGPIQTLAASQSQDRQNRTATPAAAAESCVLADGVFICYGQSCVFLRPQQFIKVGRAEVNWTGVQLSCGTCLWKLSTEQLMFVDLGMFLKQMLCTAALDRAVSGFVNVIC